MNQETKFWGKCIADLVTVEIKPLDLKTDRNLTIQYKSLAMIPIGLQHKIFKFNNLKE
jgi:hypothetical protein